MFARHNKSARAFALLVIIGALLATMVHGGTPASAAVAKNPSLPPNRSFCAYSAHSVAQLHEFEALIGRQVDCAMLFNDRTATWDAWSNPWFLTSGANSTTDWVNWATANSSRRVILTQSFAPASGMPTDWLHRAALGQYKSYATALATNLVRAGLGNSVIRIAPEANGWWNSYSVPFDAAGQADWRAAWVNMVTAMRSVVGAHFVFDWCVNYTTWGHGRNVIQLKEFYPGDAYVDIVGLDAYDENSSHWSGRWWFQVTRMGGIRDVYTFAQSHGKPMSMPEWGMLPWGGAMGGGGDDPSYVTGMGVFIATHNVAYSGYWYAGDSTTVLKNSSGLQQLRRYFGVSGSARNSAFCSSYCAGLAQ